MFTSELKVEFIDRMGSDARVVNAARVSFDKQIEEELGASPRDEKLISYLARHSHWTPFAHCQATFRVSIPVFLARQYFKHIVGSVKNEISRRYVTSEPEFYLPKWRLVPEDGIKQGSGELLDRAGQDVVTEEYKKTCQQALRHYQSLMGADVCAEQARMALPQAMMTSFYDTGSLIYWARMYKQRTEATAQKEWREVCAQIGEHCSKYFPKSWEELTK